jgi:hypothetical protein
MHTGQHVDAIRYGSSVPDAGSCIVVLGGPEICTDNDENAQELLVLRDATVYPEPS